MKNSARSVRVYLVALLFSASILLAQLQLSTIRGTVADTSGAAVPGARITIADVKTNVTARSLVSDASGNFEVPDLVAGVYRLTAEASRF